MQGATTSSTWCKSGGAIGGMGGMGGMGSMGGIGVQCSTIRASVR